MKENILNRYTSLPILLDMLGRSKITLLSPETWEDRNDSFFIEEYKNKFKFKSVLALCFSTKSETFHHWKVFSDGSSGVCIEFHREHLLESITNDINVTVAGHIGKFRTGDVKYKWIHELEADPPKPTDWPFIKRNAFEDEGEFRMIYESISQEGDAKAVEFDILSIRKITLSPWMPKSVAETVKSIIHRNLDSAEIKVYHSSLLDNSKWKSVLERPNKSGYRQ
jgi:hypothetical protein